MSGHTGTYPCSNDFIVNPHRLFCEADEFGDHNGYPFSTYDVDPDGGGNCAERENGGWWFDNCDFANLNGLYYHTPLYNASRDYGIEWSGLMDTHGWDYYSFKGTKMMVRPSVP